METNPQTQNILTGDPGGDISFFLKSKKIDQDFSYGVNLIRTYADNNPLCLFLESLVESNSKLAHRKLILNLKAISIKWKK